LKGRKSGVLRRCFLVGLKMAVVVVLVVVVVERAGALKDFGDEVDATRVTSQHRDPQ
jgi:hypothetical protein